MSTFRRLPPKPSLEFVRKEAKALLRQLRAGDLGALERVRVHYPQIRNATSPGVRLVEAQLVIAREYGFPGWPRMISYIKRAEQKRRASEGRYGSWEPEPFEDARKAIAAADLLQLEGVVAANPQLLEDLDDTGGRRPTLMNLALAFESRVGIPEMRPIMEWLEARGFNRQLALNQQLCGRIKMPVERVRELLHQGADPNWISPDGITVLEYALMNYWNGEAVDLIAARTAPRRALWIAAGLGDVSGVQAFLDSNGKPTAAAHRLRPHFDAAAVRLAPQSAAASDEEILLEALIVALLNGRTKVLEYMISRGAPIDSTMYGAPLMQIAVGNLMNDVVKCLVQSGVAVDDGSREMAREYLEQRPEDVDRRRLVELCGMDPETLMAERDARAAEPPELHPHLVQALQLASDDAVRLGQNAITNDNLLIGMLRNRQGALMYFTRLSGLDLDRFRADMKDRMLPSAERVDHDALPADPHAQAVIEAAIRYAADRRRDIVLEFNLLRALLESKESSAAQLMESYGGNVKKVMEALDQGL